MKNRTDRSNNFLGSVYTVFSEPQDQQKLVISFERKFPNIIRAYMNNKSEDIKIRRKLGELLDNLSTASDPYLFDDDMLEEIFKLETTVKDFLQSLSHGKTLHIHRSH